MTTPILTRRLIVTPFTNAIVEDGNVHRFNYSNTLQDMCCAKCSLRKKMRRCGIEQLSSHVPSLHRFRLSIFERLFQGSEISAEYGKRTYRGESMMGEEHKTQGLAGLSDAGARMS